MADRYPRVVVDVGAVTVNPGETITLYVTGPDSTKVQVEVRSVGGPGNVGHPEVYCDEIISLRTFKGWRPMDVAVRERQAAVKLIPPVPPTPRGEE